MADARKRVTRGKAVGFAITLVGVIASVLAVVLVPHAQGWATSTWARATGVGGDCNGQVGAMAYYDGRSQFSGTTTNAQGVVDATPMLSTTTPGRVDVKVRTHHAEGRPAEVLLIHGTYGFQTNYDFVLLDLKAANPEPGSCVTWYRYHLNEDQSKFLMGWTLPALWGEHTYCFTLITGADFKTIQSGGGVVHSPYCAVMKWENAWGEMKFS